LPGLLHAFFSLYTYTFKPNNKIQIIIVCHYNEKISMFSLFTIS